MINISIDSIPFAMYKKFKVVKIWGPVNKKFTCTSREGKVYGKVGDYFCEDGHGGYYPISPEFMNNNYREDGINQ